MPAILVMAGAYAIPGATGWALFAAGTMVVSGLMARKAEIDGNKDAAAGWMAVGTIASLGASFTKPDAALTAGNSTAGGIDAAAEASAVKDAAAAGIDQSISGAAKAGETVSTMSQSGGIGVTNATSSAGGGWQEALAARDARMAEIAANNLKVQAGTGLATAAVAWQSGEEQAKVKREAIAEERRLSDRQYANTNNLTDLKVQTPGNLPNLMSSARRQGLINATATTVQ